VADCQGVGSDGHPLIPPFPSNLYWHTATHFSIHFHPISAVDLPIAA
jgi:hypothetical protein